MTFQSIFPSSSVGCLFDGMKGRAGNKICFSVLIAPIHGAFVLLSSSKFTPAQSVCFLLCCVKELLAKERCCSMVGGDVVLWSAAFMPAEHPCSDLNAVCAPLDSWSVWFVCCSSCHSIMQSLLKCWCFLLPPDYFSCVIFVTSSWGVASVYLVY